MTAQQYLRLVVEQQRLGISSAQLFDIAVSVEPTLRGKRLADLETSQTHELIAVLCRLEEDPKAPKEANR